MQLDDKDDFDYEVWRRKNDPTFHIDEAKKLLKWLNANDFDAVDSTKLSALDNFIDMQAAANLYGEKLLAAFKDLTDRRILALRLKASIAENERCHWN